MKKLLAFALLTFTLLATIMAGFTSTASANNTVELSPIIDNADVFTSEEEVKLETAFRNAEEYYGIVPVIETVETVPDRNYEQFANDRGNALEVGDAETNNGLYLLFVKEDRYYYMLPGLGLKETMDSEVIQKIVNSLAIPQFKKEDYYRGVVNSVGAFAETYANGGEPAGALAEVDNFRSKIGLICLGIFVLIAGGLIISLVKTYMRSDIYETAKARRRMTDEEKASAKKAWDSLTDEQKEELESAENEEQRKKILEDSGYNGGDILPLLVLMYLTTSMGNSVTTGQNSYDGSSNNSSSYSGGSFGGGSFGGGGAGGGW